MSNSENTGPSYRRGSHPNSLKNLQPRKDSEQPASLPADETPVPQDPLEKFLAAHERR